MKSRILFSIFSFVGVLIGVGYELFCAPQGRTCSFFEYREVIEFILWFSIGLFFVSIVLFWFSKSVLNRFFPRLLILVIFLIIFVLISPEFTNIGDPTPQREAGMRIGGVIIFIWSLSYLIFQKIKEEKSV